MRSTLSQRLNKSYQIFTRYHRFQLHLQDMILMASYQRHKSITLFPLSTISNNIILLLKRKKENITILSLYFLQQGGYLLCLPTSFTPPTTTFSYRKIVMKNYPAAWYEITVSVLSKLLYTAFLKYL